MIIKRFYFVGRRQEVKGGIKRNLTVGNWKSLLEISPEE